MVVITVIINKKWILFESSSHIVPNVVEEILPATEDNIT